MQQEVILIADTQKDIILTETGLQKEQEGSEVVVAAQREVEAQETTALLLKALLNRENQTKEVLLIIEKVNNLRAIVTILRKAKVQEVILLHLGVHVALHLEVALTEAQEVLLAVEALEVVGDNLN